MRFELLETRQLLSAAPLGRGIHTPPPSLALVVQPDDIFEIAGATPLTGKVVRTGSTAAAVSVSISISDPNSELVSDAAIPVTIPANASSATFQLPAANLDATPDGTTSIVTLTATDTAAVLSSATAKVEVVDPVVSVCIPQQKILETSTSTFTGYVSVNTPASLNTSGITVSLSSSDTGELKLPATVTIPAGKTSASFTFTPIADDGTTTDRTTSVTVSPTLSGYFGKSAAVQVIDPQVSVHLASSTIVEVAGNTATGYVSVNTGPVATDTVVTLTGSDAGAELKLPATVTILAGSTSAKFTYSAVVDTTADAPVSVTVTPTVATPGYFSQTATVQVVDPTLSVRIDPGTISEVAGVHPSSTYGVVTLNTPVPAADTSGLTISLTETVGGTASKEVTIPASVTILAGQRCATFKIATVPDTTPDGPVTVTVTATDASGFASSGSGNVTVVDQSLILGVFVPPTISEAGAKAVQGVVYLNAPVSTTLTTGLTVTLTETVGGSTSTEVTIPTSVTIKPGQWFATFAITPIADTTPDGPVVVTITASDSTGTAASGSATTNVVDSLPSPWTGGGDFFARAADVVFSVWGRKN